MEELPPPPARELLDLLTGVPAGTSRYGLRDDRGQAMDTVKVVADPAGGYLGVYHVGTGDGFDVHVATSVDLLAWTHRARLDTRASQPTIAAVPGGGFLVVLEAGGHGRPASLRFLRYRDTGRLLAADADRVFDAPHTLAPPGRLAEGTPNVYAISVTRDGGETVDVGFHYFRPGRFGRGDVDRQGRGTLRDLRHWTARREPRLDAALQARGVAGNIGGRDFFSWRGAPFSLIEGQLRKRRWETWRVFLYDWTAGVAWPVPIRTAAGSVSFGNPTATLLTAPSGRRALLVTAYLFPAGAAPGEAGPLLYYRELPS
jgi:hypothetical protein